MAGPQRTWQCLPCLLAMACGPGPVVAIDAGKDYVCARFRRGDTACHNYDAAGGPDDWEDSLEWPSLETPDERLVSTTTRYVHFCGLDKDGRIHCTGRKEYYAPLPSDGFAEVTAGNYSTCALDAEGEATCWGTSFYETDQEHYNGSDLAPPPGPFLHLHPHDNGWCGQRTDGTMSCWGFDWYGAASPPEGVAFELIFPKGSNVYCGLTLTGETRCWGAEDQAPAFQAILTQAAPYVDAQLGKEAACTLSASGEARCTSLPGQDPNEYQPPSGVRFQQISAGFRFFCGLTDQPVDGHRVLCWGCRWDNAGVPDNRPGECVPPPW